MWQKAAFLITIMASIQSGASFKDVLEERKDLFDKEIKMMLGHNITLSDSELKANDLIMALKVEEIDNGLINPKNFNLSKHFFEFKDKVKNTKLFQLIQMMPKGAILHAHDTGILSPDYVLKLTYMENLYVCFNDSDVRFQFSQTGPDCTCTTKWQLISEAREASGNVLKFDANLKRHFSIVIDNPSEIYTDVNAVWHKFQNYFICTEPLMTYRLVWEKYFYDTLVALRNDNVMYFEIRSVLPPLYDLEGNVFDSIATAQTYKQVADLFKRDNPDFFGVKLIYAPMKQVDKPKLKEYIRIAKELKRIMPDFFAGFDLVGQEDVGVPLNDFLPELFEAGKELDLFLHAGETNWYGTTSDENLFDAVVLNAKRIGHGFALVKHPILMEEVKKRNIGIEVNIISNSVLKLVEDVRNHPLATFLSQNMPVVLSSDDPGLWGAEPLTHDFYIAFAAVSSRHADLRVLKQLALNSLYYSTYPNKDKLVHEFEIRWTKFIDSVVKDQW